MVLKHVKLVLTIATLLTGEPGVGRIFNPCDLGIILMRNGIKFEKLGDWICLAHACSRYDSSKISGVGTNRHNLLEYGIFQISNYYYCEDEFKKKYNDCGLKCADLIDDELEDDIKCAKLIYNRKKQTFRGWFQFAAFCSNNSNEKFYADCDFATGVKPVIISPNTDVALHREDLYAGMEIVKCLAEGTLPIEMKWFKNQKPLSNMDPDLKVTNEEGVFANQSNSVIVLRHVNFTFDEYVTLLTCVAKNQYGTSSKDFLFKILKPPVHPLLPTETMKKPKMSKATELIIAVLSTAVIIILLGLCVYKCTPKKEVELTRKEIQDFYKGNPENSIQADSQIHERLLLEPYNEEFEIRKRDLIIDTNELLGSGEFGMVYKATYLDKDVAVKTLKPGAGKRYLEALLSELKVLIYIKGHLNVTEIIGAYTKELSRGSVLVILEYCPMGSLRKYLQRYRERTEAILTSKKRSISQNSTFENSDEVLDLPVMLGWSYQIASAMEYLTSKNVIHGDLAARNTLLSSLKTIKVADFGLSRRIHDYATYVRGPGDGELLPWRWLSPESLSDLKFSSSSDVWSYGVTLWEIFTYAQIPYAGHSWAPEFLRSLKAGLRLEKPDGAPTSVFEIMQDCWKLHPGERPSFSTLRQRLYTQDYIQLDRTTGPI